MSVVIRGQGLTRNRHLCATCGNCVRVQHGVQTEYHCRTLGEFGPKLITHPVEACSSYAQEELIRTKEFYKTGYVLVTTEGGEKKFVTPEEYNGEVFAPRRARKVGFNE